MQRVLDLDTKKHEELNDYKATLEARLEELATKKSVERFEMMMLEFARYEHIQKLKEEVLPKVAKFTELIE
jgi:hypothetical protein